MRKRGSRVSSGKNNNFVAWLTYPVVVNCFRISIFAVAKTIPIIPPIIAASL